MPMWLISAEEKARMAALLAARNAAAHVTPGQREKAIADAASAVRSLDCCDPVILD
jgi:hypothetical protein